MLNQYFQCRRVNAGLSGRWRDGGCTSTLTSRTGRQGAKRGGRRTGARTTGPRWRDGRECRQGEWGNRVVGRGQLVH